MFKLDDKVRVIRDADCWLAEQQPRDTVLTVVDEYSVDEDNSNFRREISLYFVNKYSQDFELVFSASMAEAPKLETQFIVDGTRVLINKAFVEKEATVRAAEGCWRLNVNDGGFVGGFVTSGLGLGLLGEQAPENITPLKRHDDIVDGARFAITHKSIAESANNVLGVYRPNLEDRKVGKVGMHMVVDGFPRALREVAKVMTWAAEHKGYKLHDWRNLPNADVELPAAEYRHQNDSCIQKAEGVPAIERTDHESKLLHSAHKVFNALAELELVLAGVIK